MLLLAAMLNCMLDNERMFGIYFDSGGERSAVTKTFMESRGRELRVQYYRGFLRLVKDYSASPHAIRGMSWSCVGRLKCFICSVVT